MTQLIRRHHEIELSTRELVIGEPHDQPNLVTRIPADRLPVQVINFYHFRGWPREKAYCAKCEGHRHRDGFTIELDDGSWALAGSKCASDLWGDNWKSVRNKFNDELRDAGIILDIRPSIPELRLIHASLEASWRATIHAVAEHQRRFRGAAEPLFNTLKSAALRPDHCITLYPSTKIYLDGWAFFAIENISEKFETALDQIRHAISAGEGKPTELGARTVNLRQTLDHLDNAAQAVRGLRSFFAPKELRDLDNILHVAMTKLGSRFSGRYDVKHGQIVDLLTQQPISNLTSYPLLNIEPLRRLRNLMA